MLLSLASVMLGCYAHSVDSVSLPPVWVFELFYECYPLACDRLFNQADQ